LVLVASSRGPSVLAVANVTSAPAEVQNLVLALQSLAAAHWHAAVEEHKALTVHAPVPVLDATAGVIDCRPAAAKVEPSLYVKPAVTRLVSSVVLYVVFLVSARTLAAWLALKLGTVMVYVVAASWRPRVSVKPRRRVATAIVQPVWFTEEHTVFAKTVCDAVLSA